MTEPQLFSIEQVAGKLHKSKRWLNTYLKANPFGRSEDDLVKLLDSLPQAGERHGSIVPSSYRSRSRAAQFQAHLDSLPNHTPRGTRKKGS